jgi:pimeloyl-ACP methyl ester carboxylesterase
MRRRASRCAGALAALALLLTAVPAAAAARERQLRVESIPVSFRVVNSNTSGVPCASDGRTYTVRGHLTGPRAALERPRAVTLYLFGYDAGEWNWRLRSVRGYDHAAGMARRGHVSLTLDELGYDSSDHPEGMATCVGAQADMAHQIVGLLRAGRYAARRWRAPRFSTVVLAGHDIGGLVAEIEAYSYQDIDALIQVTWADQGQTPYIVERASVSGFDWCTTQPQPAEDGQPGSPSGYHYFTSSRQEFRQKLFFRADPRVLEAAGRLRNRNPCGMIRSTPTGVWVDMIRASEITVPVLVVFGAEDTLVWSRDGERQQQQDYPRSHDRTTAFVPRAGHFPMLERSAPEFRKLLASWLERHGA